MKAMNAIVLNFAEEMRSDKQTAAFADAFLTQWRELEAEAICNAHQRQYAAALLLIMTEPGRSLDERLEAADKLHGLPDTQLMIPSPRRFLGWH